MGTENLWAAYVPVIGLIVDVEASPLLVLRSCEPGQGRNAATVACLWCASEIRSGVGFEDNLQLVLLSISRKPTYILKSKPLKPILKLIFNWGGSLVWESARLKELFSLEKRKFRKRETTFASRNREIVGPKRTQYVLSELVRCKSHPPHFSNSKTF